MKSSEGIVLWYDPYPPADRVVKMKPEETMPFSPNRLNERGVRFDGSQGPGYGVEASVPLSPSIKSEIHRRTGIDIPSNVTNTTYLDLAPQESIFPVKLRTRRTHKESQKIDDASTLYRLRTISSGRYSEKTRATEVAKLFSYLLEGVFNHDDQAKREFSTLLAQSEGTDLAIAIGHGNWDPHVMGEQYNQTLKKGGHIVERKGNIIYTNEIIDMYNYPHIYAGLVFFTCNPLRTDLKAKKVALAYREGEVYEQQRQTRDEGKTIVKPPRKK